MNFEEAVALDGKIESFAGLCEFAVGEDFRSGDGACAVADLEAGGNLGAAGLIGTGDTDILIKQILKLDLALLESCGVNVGKVVGNHIQIHLL